MKIIDTTSISTTAGMRFKAGSLLFLQQSYKEALNALGILLAGTQYNQSNVYILYGCVNTGVAPAVNISAGAIFYYGEIFLVPAVNFTPATGQVAVGTISTTFFNDPTADPVQFTDGVSRSVHQIRQMIIASAVSGSGIADYANWLQTSIPLIAELPGVFPSSCVVDFQGDQSLFYTTPAAAGAFAISFNLANAIPGSVVRLKVTIPASSTLAVNAATGQTVILESGSLASTIGANNVFYFMYCGINAAGNAEIAYQIKQF